MEFIKYFDLLVLLFLILIWVGLISFLYFKKKKNFVYLIFFTIFFIYVAKVLDYTLFQFQSLLLLKHFLPNLILRGQEASRSLNLIPLITLNFHDLRTSLLNILLMIPFGFGLPFITNLRMKKVVVSGLFFSVLIEVLQFATGAIAKITFRVADINDVIFNTIGVVIGYVLFVGFVHLCHYLFSKESNNPFLQYISELK